MDTPEAAGDYATKYIASAEASRPDNSNPGADEAMTLIGSLGHPNGWSKIWVFRLLGPTSNGVAATVGITSTADKRIWGYYFLSGVDQSDPNGTVATASGTGTLSSVTASGSGLVLNAAGWRLSNVNPTINPTPGAGQTAAWALHTDELPGIADMQGGGSSGASSPEWTWSSSRDWVAAAVAVNSG